MLAFIHSIKSGGWWPFAAVEIVEIVCRYVPVMNTVWIVK